MTRSEFRPLLQLGQQLSQASLKLAEQDSESPHLAGPALGPGSHTPIRSEEGLELLD